MILQKDLNKFKKRINKEGFAKWILWLCVKSNEKEVIYTKEVIAYFKITQQASRNKLNHLVLLELISKERKGISYVYKFLKKNGSYKIEKYSDRAKKTLGIK